MYALVDANAFYCSCERLFNPGLEGRPVIVLSNNDGCAIARNDEAKQVGIVMGTPGFLLQEQIRKYRVAVFSSNYTLYGDMSDRVMQTLASFCPRMEIYSIDEAYLDLHGMPTTGLRELALQIRHTVRQHTGIPVSVGIAPTKTLAKMANHYAKKRHKQSGVFCATREHEVTEMLGNTPVEDISGVGHVYATLLRANGFQTASQFASAPEEWVRVHMSVVGQRLLTELHGIAAIADEFVPPAKKNITTSRSFGHLLTKKADIAEALSNYAANVALKLRNQHSHCKTINVFIQTNPHRIERPQYLRSVDIQLEHASNDSTEIIRHALRGLDLIFRAGFDYMKAGIVASDLGPEDVVQQQLFGSGERVNGKKVMDTMDQINKGFGKEMLRMATQGFKRSYRLRADHLSQKYTTRESDLLTVHI